MPVPPSEGPPAFDFGTERQPRRPSLTPLVDVVFLLLVFFMLAARFGAEATVPLVAAGGAATPWSGPPRLVELGGDGALSLNGRPVALADLAGDLAPLMPSPDAPVILRPGEGTEVQALVDVLAALRAAGIVRLAVVD